MTGSAANQLLAQIDAAWQPFRAAVDRFGETDLANSLPSGWTAKEMLGHVAFWDEAVEGAVTSLFRKRALPEGWKFGSDYAPAGDWPSAEVHNAREAEWARDRTSEEVLRRLVNAHERLEAFLATVTEDETVEHAGYFADLGKHYTEHLGDLR